MKLAPVLAGMLVGLAALGCQEKLATPTDCPELCPGTSLVIRDTVLTARVGLDSTFTGYLSADLVGALLVSNGLAAGEARAFAVFPSRGDSIFVNGLRVTYDIDSVALSFSLIARDTAMRGVRLLVHRIPPTVDTNTTLAELDAWLTPETLIDSVLISDTLRSGTVRLIVKGETLDRLLPNEADSGRLGIGVRVNAEGATGVRLGSANSGFRPPLYTTFVHAHVADTAQQRTSIALDADVSNYVIETPPPPSPDLLFLGGKSGSRILLRFTLPPVIKDSAAIVRATLELTLVGPLKGLPNDPGQVQLRPVLVDLGAKSPAVSIVAAASELAAGATGVHSIDIRSIVETWTGANGLTPTLLLGLAPEGGTFSRPEFFSSLSVANAPRLRITYAISSHPGHP